MKKKITKLPERVIKSFLVDESGASKTYGKIGKKYHDPILEQMSRDEHRHHAYWMKVNTIKNRKRKHR